MERYGSAERTRTPHRSRLQRSSFHYCASIANEIQTFYTALGWRPYPSFHLHLRTDSLARTQAHITAPTIKLLHTPDLEELCRRDERELKRRLCQISAEDKIAIAVAPDYQTMRWHHAREAFICHELGRELPAIKGALAKYSQGQAWCVWTRVWNSSEKGSGENSLQILRLVAGDDKAKRRSNAEEHGATDISKSMAIAALLQEALHQADQWGLSAVEIWNPNEEIQAASREVSKISKLIERTNHNIPSMKWFGEMAIDSPEAPSESIVWLASEKFGWC